MFHFKLYVKQKTMIMLNKPIVKLNKPDNAMHYTFNKYHNKLYKNTLAWRTSADAKFGYRMTAQIVILLPNCICTFFK